MRKIWILSIMVLLLLSSFAVAPNIPQNYGRNLNQPIKDVVIPSEMGCDTDYSCSDALSKSGDWSLKYDTNSNSIIDTNEILKAIADGTNSDSSKGTLSYGLICAMVSIWQKNCPVVKCDDKDNTPDPLATLLTLPLTPEKDPSYFARSSGKGIYYGSNGHVIIADGYVIGTDIQSIFPYSVYFDHCTEDSRISEAYCTSDGMLSAHDAPCPNGCKGGACLKPINPKCSSDSECPSSQNTFCSVDKFCYQSSIGKCINPGTDSAYCGQVSGDPNCQVCPNGCSNGQCNQVPICTKSDGGRDYYTKGKLEASGWGITYDSCFEENGASMLDEYYCNKDGSVGVTKFKCPGGCVDGACIKPNILCKDTDNSPDYSINIPSQPYTPEKDPALFQKGHGKGIYMGSSDNVIIGEEGFGFAKPSPYPYSIVYDNCYNNQLNEVYCTSDGKLASIGATCPDGCSNGACIKPLETCKDSDGGVDPFTKGICKDIKGSVGEDGCLKSDGTGPLPAGEYVSENYCLTPEMREYCKKSNSAAYCDNTPDGCYVTSFIPSEDYAWTYFPKSNVYFCENGCKNGACIKAPIYTCTDSDGGINEFVRGTVKISSPSTVEIIKSTKLAVENLQKDELQVSPPTKNQELIYAEDTCLSAQYITTIALLDKKTFTVDGISNKIEVIGVNAESGTVKFRINNVETKAETFSIVPVGSTVMIVGNIYPTDTPSPAAKVEVYFGLSPGGNGNSGNLLEFYCKGDNKLGAKVIGCTSGCSAGACVSPTSKCTDTDGGKDYYTTGKVIITKDTGLAYAVEDRCVPYAEMQNDITSVTQTITPVSGTATSSEVSGGQMMPVPGTERPVSPPMMYKRYLLEQFCNEDGIGYGTVTATCPNGCSDGACVKEEIPSCIAEGELGNYFSPELKCCEGLVASANAKVSSITVPLDSDVSSQVPTCYQPEDGSFVCTQCGNGVCGAGENICNCREDCDETDDNLNKCEVNGGYCQTVYKCADDKCGPAPTCIDGYYNAGELECNSGFCCLPKQPVSYCEASGGYCNVMPPCNADACIDMMPGCKEGYYASGQNFGCNGQCCLPDEPTNACELNNGKCLPLGIAEGNTCELEYNLETISYACAQTNEGITACCAPKVVPPPITPCAGCVYNDACLPVGTRVSVEGSGNFCDTNKQLKAQFPEENTCMNNYECKSNLCVNDQCVSGGFFTKMMEWFKRLFGG